MSPFSFKKIHVGTHYLGINFTTANNIFIFSSFLKKEEMIIHFPTGIWVWPPKYKTSNEPYSWTILVKYTIHICL